MIARCPVPPKTCRTCSTRHSRSVPKYICHFLSLASNILLIIYVMSSGGQLMCVRVVRCPKIYSHLASLHNYLCCRCWGPLRPVAESARGRRIRPTSIGLRCLRTAQLLINLISHYMPLLKHILYDRPSSAQSFCTHSVRYKWCRAFFSRCYAVHISI